MKSWKHPRWEDSMADFTIQPGVLTIHVQPDGEDEGSITIEISGDSLKSLVDALNRMFDEQE